MAKLDNQYSQGHSTKHDEKLTIVRAPLRLSKSRILSGLQCERRLWLETYNRELREVDAGQQVVFDSGHELGELARLLYGPGILIEHVDDIARAIAETAPHVRLLRGRKTLFEPAFAHDGVVARADVLRPTAGGYSLVEVKGSTSVKDYYIDDCAAQAWIIEHSGVKLTSIKLAHLDNSFVYQGDGNYRGLLRAQNITKRVRERMALVPEWVGRFRGMLGRPEPERATGDHCDIPFGCPFFSHCRSKEPPSPEFPVSLLPRGGKLIAQLIEEGYADLRDVPAGRLTNALHLRVHASTLTNETYLDRTATKVLKRLGYPRYYLDFETIAFAIPRWTGTRPYQQHPFQWSCQVQQRDGSITERSFLDLSGASPLRAFATSLIEAAGTTGPIIVYNQSFEASRLRELAEMFPDLRRRIAAIASRLFDLLPLVRANYYHPAMKGSWSIKSVLPTVAPELAYEHLDEVADGSDAQLAYREGIHADTSTTRKSNIENALRRYCANDTLGMVVLAAALCA